jgi:hypothetical protein
MKRREPGFSSVCFSTSSFGACNSSAIASQSVLLEIFESLYVICPAVPLQPSQSPIAAFSWSFAVSRFSSASFAFCSAKRYSSRSFSISGPSTNLPGSCFGNFFFRYSSARSEDFRKGSASPTTCFSHHS